MPTQQQERLLLNSAAVFNPAQIAGLVAWFDASTGLYQDSAGSTPATADADPVGKWTDRSGQGNHATQATTGNKPALKLAIQNGKPIIRFATDDYLSVNALATLFAGSDKPFTVFTVQKYNVASANETVFALASSASVNPFHNLVINTSSYRNNRSDDVPTAASTSGGTVDTSYHVRSDVFSGTVVSAYIDGTVIINAQAQDVGAATFNTAAIGALSQSAVIRFLNGDVAALLVYSSALSAANRLLVERYLGSRYGITVA